MIRAVLDASVAFKWHVPEQWTDRALRIRNDFRNGLAELLASKEDSQILGPTEFEVRDRVHRIGAKALETASPALEERSASQLDTSPNGSRCPPAATSLGVPPNDVERSTTRPDICCRTAAIGPS